MNLKQLSESLGLSQTTVSRALNGYPEVSETTRHRVKQAALKNNYNPNTRAKGLATGRAMVIGHVLPTFTQRELVNPIFSDFIAGASSVYSDYGYDMMISLVEGDDQERTYRRFASNGSVDGIIVHSPTMNDARIEMLNEIGLPYVVHGRVSNETQPYSWVDTNNRRAFQRATQFLIDLGHVRIGLINGVDEMDYTLRRFDGYASALKKAGLSIDPELVCGGEMTEILGYDQACRLLSVAAPPTAFLVSSMISAIGVRRAISEAGLSLGTDVSVITHDDDLSYLKNGQDVPIFTSTKSSVGDAGRESAEALVSLIQNGGSAPVQKLIEAQLVVGQSTGPAPG